MRRFKSGCHPGVQAWALEDLYVTDEAWEQELATLSEDEKVLTAFAGKLADSGESLYAYMEKTEAVNAKAAPRTATAGKWRPTRFLRFSR